MQMFESKPCPFCGGTNIQAFEGSTYRWGYLACNDCGGNRGDCRKADIALPSDHETNIAAFAEDWNARTDGVPVPEPAGRVLPHSGSQEASAMLDSLLAEYNYPANPKNAARAGWEAANRWLRQSADVVSSDGSKPKECRYPFCSAANPAAIDKPCLDCPDRADAAAGPEGAHP